MDARQRSHLMARWLIAPAQRDFQQFRFITRLAVETIPGFFDEQEAGRRERGLQFKLAGIVGRGLHALSGVGMRHLGAGNRPAMALWA